MQCKAPNRYLMGMPPEYIKMMRKLVKNQEYDVIALYKDNAGYPAWNVAGFVAFLIPVGLTLIAILSGTMMWFYNYGWFTGSLLGALIYYLTGRDAPVMGAGTVQSMHGLGFPMFRGRVVLHLKPNRSVGDKAYKRGALEDVRSHRGPVVATFENDPGNANIFAEGFPEAIHVWMQTEWAPDAEEPSEVLRRLGDFRRD